jgi:peroxiredoxin
VADTIVADTARRACGRCPIPRAPTGTSAGTVNFVGIDVVDNRSTAVRFARRIKVSYPLVSDSSGSVASTYEIPAHPFTAILPPKGVLETLHPGALTTEQLDFVVENLDARLMSS